MTKKKDTEESLPAMPIAEIDPETNLRYSFRKRVSYFLRRNFVFFLVNTIALLALFWLTSYGDETITKTTVMQMIVTRTVRTGIGVWLALIFFKFYMPKIALQSEVVDNENIAVALIFVGFLLAANL